MYRNDLTYQSWPSIVLLFNATEIKDQQEIKIQSESGKVEQQGQDITNDNGKEAAST